MAPALTTYPLEILAKLFCKAVFIPDFTVLAIRTFDDRLLTLHITNVLLFVER